MKKRILCLVLAVFMLTGCLVACDGKNGGEVDGGDKNGDWANLDFKDATLKVCVSANQDKEGTFSAADKYTKGPDDASTSEPVQKKVLARNKKVAEDLNINLVYETVDLWYDGVLPKVQDYVMLDSGDSPDVFNNDIFGMTNAMLNGYLWNVTDPGEGIKSYFDFDHACWFKEYMEGTSFSKDKLYILAGDYNIDVIRFAWVFYVNIQLFDATFGTLSDGWSYNNYEDACKFIESSGDWSYDEMIALSEVAHNDENGSVAGKTDENDARIGVCLNAVTARVFFWGSDASIFEWTKNGKACEPGEGKPSMISQNEIEPVVQFGNKFIKLYNTLGVFVASEVVQSATMFMNGKTVMAMSKLGEMESEQMRATKFKRGVLPFPRYDNLSGSKMITPVHDQAEIDTILQTATSFAVASAFLQYVNELSSEILDFYYEEVLKFKYNDSRGARKMIDLAYENIGSPFDTVLSGKIFAQANVAQPYYSFRYDAQDGKETSGFSSKYASYRDKVQTTLEDMLESFERLQ